MGFVVIGLERHRPALPYIRTLYEEEEQESFHESLTVRIKAHEKDIERMCNKNYQGFIESVGELLKVKSDAMKLKVILYYVPDVHMRALLGGEHLNISCSVKFKR